ncbi:hypothetical protein [Paenibacillus elgii]|uniref:hypothetical protein n=1 Tax=Paenibacillus elgii TaxID=189691 RepID=UPI00203B1D27|nr:hypothetical protein [Paenibacillus elgii]MCM3272616.1 hypothetical protein [Paenibacillus elgii]
MGLRPKVGTKVRFVEWETRYGKPIPPLPWTGVVVEVEPKLDYLPVRYHVKRDFDGEIVKFLSRDFRPYDRQ